MSWKQLLITFEMQTKELVGTRQLVEINNNKKHMYTLFFLDIATNAPYFSGCIFYPGLSFNAGEDVTRHSVENGLSLRYFLYVPCQCIQKTNGFKWVVPH